MQFDISFKGVAKEAKSFLKPRKEKGFLGPGEEVIFTPLKRIITVI
jgi:hypothetical protein